MNQIRKIYVKIVKRYSKCNHERSKSMQLINCDYLYSKARGSPPTYLDRYIDKAFVFNELIIFS
jgi:hypothetical protein